MRAQTGKKTQQIHDPAVRQSKTDLYGVKLRWETSLEWNEADHNILSLEWNRFDHEILPMEWNRG